MLIDNINVTNKTNNMNRVQHFNHNANRVSFELFGKDFLRLTFEQMTAVEKAIKIEFDEAQF
jgi:hypothetical protein